MSQKVIMELELAQKVLQFVTSRPYGEVAEFVKELQEGIQVLPNKDGEPANELSGEESPSE
jgi:hypothetical protein